MLLTGAALLASGLAARFSAAAEHALQPVTAFAARMSARGAVPVMRRRLGHAGGVARPVLGGALALFGLLVLTGLDKRIETVATEALPQVWVELIVRFRLRRAVSRRAARS
ncbi:MAG TPA: hypothetical protein VGN83_00030 [Falsiroseomonas sp.]|jgi:hypothetical protein|nr:hypothetical protein [Falsiroseomonas sp.]